MFLKILYYLSAYGFWMRSLFGVFLAMYFRYQSTFQGLKKLVYKVSKTSLQSCIILDLFCFNIISYTIELVLILIFHDDVSSNFVGTYCFDRVVRLAVTRTTAV